MGFLDKVADFLDDGKLNDSADKTMFTDGKKKADELARAKMAAAEKSGNALSLSAEISVKFGTEPPIPYLSDGRSCFVKVAGDAVIVPLTEGLTKQFIETIVRTEFPQLIAQSLAGLAAQSVPPEQLSVHRQSMTDYVSQHFDSEQMKIEALMINAVIIV